MSNKSKKISDLLSALELEIKRLSPNLSLSLKNPDSFQQILYVVKVSIDTILEERSALRLEYSTFSKDKLFRSYSIDVRQNQASSKLLDAQKELKKFEILILKKEQKLKEREQELEIYSKKLQDQEIYLKIEEDKLYERKIELEKFFEEQAKHENGMPGVKGCDEVLNYNCETRKINLSLNNRFPLNFQSKETDICNKELELIRSQKLLLNDREIALKRQEEAFSKAKIELEKQIQEIEKHLIYASKKMTHPLQVNLDVSFSPENESNSINPKYLLNRLLSSLDEKDLQGPLMQIKDIIESFLREAEKKEKILERKSLMFSQKEESFKQRLEKIFKLEEEMQKIKADFLSFQATSMKEYDFLLNRFKLQSNSLEKNISDTEALRKKLSQNMFLNTSLS